MSSIILQIVTFFITYYFTRGYNMDIFVTQTKFRKERMNWSEFISEIENGLFGKRYSDQDLSTASGIHRQIIYMLKSGKSKSPQQATIGKLESLLGIRIKNLDSNNISYTLSDNSKPNFNDTTELTKIPLITNVGAGMSNYQYSDAELINTNYHKTDNVFALKVRGDSMQGTLNDGDTVVIDLDGDIRDNDIVVVKLKNGQQLVKRFKKLQNNMAVLLSDNQTHDPIIINQSDIEIIACVVESMRKHR